MRTLMIPVFATRVGGKVPPLKVQELAKDVQPMFEHSSTNTKSQPGSMSNSVKMRETDDAPVGAIIQVQISPLLYAPGPSETTPIEEVTVPVSWQVNVGGVVESLYMATNPPWLLLWSDLKRRRMAPVLLTNGGGKSEPENGLSGNDVAVGQLAGSPIGSADPLQSSPLNPSSQEQVPNLQRPFPEQSLRQVGSSQVAATAISPDTTTAYFWLPWGRSVPETYTRYSPDTGAATVTCSTLLISSITGAPLESTALFPYRNSPPGVWTERSRL
mmetsp:Transcript_15712/g.24417  ORF Transcript_15712/g.24417 Transcript_15712/m.24417 type:complete len:272 (-) Transcript_15712:2342-3157(-)